MPGVEDDGHKSSKRGIILISLDLVSIVSQSHVAFSSTGLVFSQNLAVAHGSATNALLNQEFPRLRPFHALVGRFEANKQRVRHIREDS